ncbi:hypothetical protein EDD15DRAFT_1538615 [Pisolithus albus]|nr:hypothetical protein EDD15DRAFT_1538615 [Pisolithus albus]
MFSRTLLIVCVILFFKMQTTLGAVVVRSIQHPQGQHQQKQRTTVDSCGRATNMRWLAMEAREYHNLAPNIQCYRGLRPPQRILRGQVRKTRILHRDRHAKGIRTKDPVVRCQLRDGVTRGRVASTKRTHEYKVVERRGVPTPGAP